MASKERAYELYIGENVELLELLDDPDASSVSTPSSSDIRTLPSSDNRTLITGLDIVANIFVDRESRGDVPNIHSLDIINPSEENLEYLKVGNTVILKAGYTYQDSYPLILAGSIVKVDIRKMPSGGRMIKMLVGEGSQQREKIVYNTTLPQTFTYEEALLDLLAKFAAYGVPTGSVQVTERFSDTQLGRVYPVYGSLETSLQKLLQGTRHRWYITGGQIYVEPISKSSEEFENTHNVSPSDIQNTVELSDSAINKTQLEQSIKTSGVTLDLDLSGLLNDSDSIKLTKDEGDPNYTDAYKNLAGTYKITSVWHQLNYRGDFWFSRVISKG